MVWHPCTMILIRHSQWMISHDMKKLEFTDVVKLAFYGDKFKVVLEDIWVRTRVFKDRLELRPGEYFAFKVPKGFGTDGASIPRIFWTIIAPFDRRILLPSQPHDFLYEKRGIHIEGVIYNKIEDRIVQEGVILDRVSRREADQVIREKMESFGAGLIMRWVVYCAVRVGGWWPWNH